jgi:bifunctional DNase/RNase
MTCQWTDCALESVASAALIQDRRRQQLVYLCQDHTEAFRKASFAAPFQSHFTCADAGWSSFDVFLLFHGADRSILWLRDVKTSRCIGFTTGPAEGYSLQARLGIIAPPTPSCHGVLANVAHELGGSIARLRVNDFSNGPSYLVLHCAIFIEHAVRTLEVAIKASDMFALALETQAPIVVRDGLIDRLPRFAAGSSGGLWLPG